jgi:carboxy-terminal domain RNA polymerase II polypeptide A small phosphatase
LGPVPEVKKGRKCLILDLDECLIHSTFAVRSSVSFINDQDSKTYDFSIALNLEKDYGLSYIYVGKRPHLDKFLEEMGKLYEIVIFTASLQRVCTCLHVASDNIVCGSSG